MICLVLSQAYGFASHRYFLGLCDVGTFQMIYKCQGPGVCMCWGSCWSIAIFLFCWSLLRKKKEKESRHLDGEAQTCPTEPDAPNQQEVVNDR